MFEISSKCKGIVIKHSVDAWFVLYIRMLIKILCGFLHVYRTQDKKKSDRCKRKKPHIHQIETFCLCYYRPGRRRACTQLGWATKNSLLISMRSNQTRDYG
jgi:cbb3-type cytochrome oxidase subunit 3